MLKHPQNDAPTISGSLVNTTSDRAGHAAAGTSLRLRMDYADPLVAVLHVAGDLDLDTAPRMAELLWSRLRTELSAIVIDLGEVRFLGVAGLELLSAAHAHADHQGIVLGVVRRTRAVERSLTAGGLDATLPCFADLWSARRAVGAGVRAVGAPPSALPLHSDGGLLCQ